MDNPFVIETNGQADWDAALTANFSVIERGFHVTERAATAISTGQILWLDATGFFHPYDPNSLTISPTALSFMAASSGDSLAALAWGIVRSLAVVPQAPGSLLYTSALTPGLVVTSPNGLAVGLGLNGGILFHPGKFKQGANIRSLGGVDYTGLGNGKVLKWSDASSNVVWATDSSGVSNVFSLSGINFAGLANDRIMKWSDATSQWVMAVDSAGGGGGGTTLAALTDVDTTGVADGKSLVWSDTSSKWHPVTISGGGGSSVNTGMYTIVGTHSLINSVQLDTVLHVSANWTNATSGDAACSVFDSFNNQVAMTFRRANGLLDTRSFSRVTSGQVIFAQNGMGVSSEGGGFANGILFRYIASDTWSGNYRPTRLNIALGGTPVTANFDLFPDGTTSGFVNVGSPPVVIQAAAVVGGNTVTFVTSPASGNYLVGMTWNPLSDVLSAPWTLLNKTTSGTDFAVMGGQALTAPGTLVQTLDASSSATMLTMMIELHGGKGVVPQYIAAKVSNGVGGVAPDLPSFPNIKDMISVHGIGLVSTAASLSAMYNVTSAAFLNNNATRQGAIGWSWSDRAVAQMVATLTASAETKGMVGLFSS